MLTDLVLRKTIMRKESHHLPIPKNVRASSARKFTSYYGKVLCNVAKSLNTNGNENS